MSLATEHADRVLEIAPLFGGDSTALLIAPRTGQTSCASDWRDLWTSAHALAAAHLPQAGALLFRNCAPPDEALFRAFASSFGSPLIGYDFASTPRKSVGEGIYTSTEYPAHQTIPLHNEQSYTLTWPRRIWFHCAVAPDGGGATPIADSRRIFAMIDRAVREEFAAKGLTYTRNYGNGLDLPWQEAFGTRDRGAVERYCLENRIACEWKADGELRTRQTCQAVARHPATDDWVWFNQAHLFHPSNLPEAVRETLLTIVGATDALPRHVRFGDGTDISEQAMSHIRHVLDRCALSFPWRSGDILMLDNMQTAHGREPFSGSRRIVVAMADPVRSAILPS
ncbi:Taurine dioxygenase, alpha-ketoglutarate-dependent [Novosphingobium sp. CF614]|uniref:TauD/TfdA family dioxygenase n=1 Tax=Novosphingobium sp. CF614 TaxID=1884364 RepID=UPI0008E4F997|nr:TauD/TfdA family dioxygenase [Novosphingobium sp. CF614]SFG29289.1 Taurine dioxygenase, alpha-ketoglutarate-dependent [Novosphingobium sp. CF614]